MTRWETRFKAVTQYTAQPESCLYLPTKRSHESQSIFLTPTTPLVALLLSPSLPGSFAAPGRGDHCRDHHIIIFLGTTQQIIFVVAMTVQGLWYVIIFCIYFIHILSSEFQFKRWKYKTRSKN